MLSRTAEDVLAMRWEFFPDLDVPLHLTITSSGRGAAHLQTSPDDVVCIPKRYASDTTASQPPVLVLPQVFLNRLPSRLPTSARPDKVMPADKRASWLQLAETLLLQKPLPNAKLARCVAYLLHVGHGRGAPEGATFQPLPWHVTPKTGNFAGPLRLNNTFARLLPVAAFKATLSAS